MSPYFEPSDELDAAQGRLEWLQERFREETYNSPSSSSSIDNLRQKIRDQERVVTMREEGEREEYNKRYASYLEAKNEYEEKYRSWRKHAEEARKVRKHLDSQSFFVQTRRRRINRTFKLGAGVPTKKLQWQILPPGKRTEEGIRQFYRGLQARNPRAEYDLNRIEKALELGPNLKASYEEIEEMEGYTIFTYPDTSSVLLECPKVGNAIYVIHSDYERWSGMTKQELMADTSGEVVRIPHQGDWFGKVKRELRME
jgi:hypothetical protein